MQNTRLRSFRRAFNRQMGTEENGGAPYFPTIQTDAAITGGISHAARQIKDRHEKEKQLTAEQQYGAGLKIPRCSMQSYSGTILETNVPQLFLQSNPLRTSLLIANPAAHKIDGSDAGSTFIVSFNYPASLGPQDIDTGLFRVDGVPVAPGENLKFIHGGAVPYNEIWVTGPQFTFVTIYEAMPLGNLLVT